MISLLDLFLEFSSSSSASWFLKLLVTINHHLAEAACRPYVDCASSRKPPNGQILVGSQPKRLHGIRAIRTATTATAPAGIDAEWLCGKVQKDSKKLRHGGAAAAHCQVANRKSKNSADTGITGDVKADPQYPYKSDGTRVLATSAQIDERKEGVEGISITRCAEATRPLIRWPPARQEGWRRGLKTKRMRRPVEMGSDMANQHYACCGLSTSGWNPRPGPPDRSIWLLPAVAIDQASSPI